MKERIVVPGAKRIFPQLIHEKVEPMQRIPLSPAVQEMLDKHRAIQAIEAEARRTCQCPICQERRRREEEW